MKTDAARHCEAEHCLERAVFHVSWFAEPRCEQEQHWCESHAKAELTNLRFDEQFGKSQATQGDVRCYDIRVIIITESYEQQVVYLQEVGSKNCFPMLIGIFEATALDRTLKGFRASRPLTHDAMYSLVGALGGIVQDVCIDEFEEHTFFTNFTKLRIRQGEALHLLDIRPSDAFVIAVLANRPIMVSEKVISVLGLK